VENNFNYLRESRPDLNLLFDSVKLDQNTVSELFHYSELGRKIVIDVSNFMLSLVYHYVNDYKYFMFFDEISFLDKYWFLEDLMNNFLLQDPQNLKLIEDYYNNDNAFLLLFYYPLLHNYLSNSFVMSSITSNNFYDLDYNKNFLFHLVLITKKLYDNDTRNIFTIILIEKILLDDDEEFNHDKLYSRQLRDNKLKEYEKKIQDISSSLQKQNVNSRRLLNVEISKNISSLLANLSTANQTEESESISAGKTEQTETEQNETEQTETEQNETEQTETLRILNYRLKILKNKINMYSQLERVYKSRPEFDNNPNFLLGQTTEISDKMLNSLFDNQDKHLIYIHSNLNYGIDFVLCMSFFFNNINVISDKNNVVSLPNKSNIEPDKLYYYNIVKNYVSFIKIFNISELNTIKRKINSSLGKKINRGFDSSKSLESLKQTQALKPKKKIISPNTYHEININESQENIYDATENNFKKLYISRFNKSPGYEKKNQMARPTSSAQSKTIYNISQQLLNRWDLGTEKWQPVSKKTQKMAGLANGNYLVYQQIFKNKKISDFYKEYASEIHVNCIYYKDHAQNTQYCGIYPHVTVICNKKYLKQHYPGILNSVDPTEIYNSKSIIVHYGIFLSPFTEKKKYWYTLVNLENEQQRISINIKNLSRYTYFLMDFNAIAESVLNSFLRELLKDNIEYPEKYKKNILNKNKFNYKKPHCFSN
jgi:hypothetical protein